MQILIFAKLSCQTFDRFHISPTKAALDDLRGTEQCGREGTGRSAVYHAKQNAHELTKKPLLSMGH